MVCLDTDVIVHFLRKNEESVELINKILESKQKIKITSINEFELWKGIYKTNNKNREKSLRQFLSSVVILYLDSDSAQKAAEIFQILQHEGNPVDALDVMIAAIAIINHETVLTMNRKHFERIKELNLI
ncbi:MAG: type II toxin-antitoxin system VapC family toxin [Nanoarchaeota archaeon]